MIPHNTQSTIHSVTYCGMDDYTLPKDCWFCIFSSGNVTSGKDFKSIRLVCKDFLKILSVTIPNGDVEFANPFLTLLGLFEVNITTITHISSWMSCEDILKRLDVGVIVSVYNTYGMSDVECLKKGLVPMSILQDRYGYKTILKLDSPPRDAIMELFFDKFYQFHKSNPITLQEYETHKGSWTLSGDDSVVSDGMLPCDAIGLFGYRVLNSPFVSIGDVRKYGHLTSISDIRDWVLRNSMELRYTDFFDGLVLKEEFQNHAVLKDLLPSDCIRNNCLDGLDAETRADVLRFCMENTISYCSNTKLTPKEHKFVFGGLGGSGLLDTSETPIESAITLCENVYDWVVCLQYYKYTWKDAIGLVEKAVSSGLGISKKEAVSSVLRNGFGRVMYTGYDY